MNSGKDELADNNCGLFEPLIFMSRIARLEDQYQRNKRVSVGSVCTCPICGRYVLKRTKQQAFDSTQCRKQYWKAVAEKHRRAATVFK